MRTIGKGRRPVTAVVAALLAVGVIAAPVVAAAPEAVTIVSNVTFAPEGEPNFGDFTTSGPATVSGRICASGTFVDTGIRFAGFQSGRGEVQLQVFKRFTCSGGDTFDVKMQIQANFDTGIETFTWVVIGGSGRFASLRGGGSGSTVPTETGNINTYVGSLH